MRTFSASNNLYLKSILSVLFWNVARNYAILRSKDVLLKEKAIAQVTKSCSTCGVIIGSFFGN